MLLLCRILISTGVRVRRRRHVYLVTCSMPGYHTRHWTDNPSS